MLGKRPLTIGVSSYNNRVEKIIRLWINLKNNQRKAFFKGFCSIQSIISPLFVTGII